MLQDEAKALRESFLAWAKEPVEAPQISQPGLSSEAGFVAFGPARNHWMPVLGHEGWANDRAGAGLAFRESGRWRSWSASATLLATTEAGGQQHLRLPVWSLAWERRWRIALEQSPLQWGYGFTGSYLFGSTHRPFPRLDLRTPSWNVHPFGIPLGTWRFETFLGRLESDRRIPEWNSERSSALLAEEKAGGPIRRPFQSGYRAIATFGPHIEMTFSASSMWGGVNPDGTSRTRGYGFGDYLLAFFGAENLKVERSTPTPTTPALDADGYKASSNALALVEARVRIPPLAQLIGAQGVFVYGGLGGENVRWQWREFLRHPFASIRRDIKEDESQRRDEGHFSKPHPGRDRPLHALWNRDDRESVPNLSGPNGNVGFQVLWSGWDLGFEHMDNRTRFPPGVSYQTYTHGGYLAAHSRDGDPLGYTFGGSVIVESLQVGIHRGGFRWLEFTFSRGLRYFRDDAASWLQLHPGKDLASVERFAHAQIGIQQRLEAWRLGGTLAYESSGNADFEAGHRQASWSFLLGLSRVF